MVILFSLVFVGNAPIGTVQGYEAVRGIITSDTTWTKANSPYNLTGNIAIDEGVTLNIEAGVTINLNGYYIRVNGTLIAKGTSTDNILFNGGSIKFTQLSNSWNEQTGTGSIIENSIINSLLATGGGSPKIINNEITESITLGGNSPILSKNTIEITGTEWLSSKIGIWIVEENSAYISDNIISGSFDTAGIQIDGGSPTIERNQISNDYGYGSSEDRHQAGILISNNASPIIKQNTITKNAIGISLAGYPTPTIINNNIEENSNYNLRMSVQVDIAAANNWWGTTDTAVIDQKIYDYNDDFNLGKINYTPFLTAPNPQAVPDPNAPTPTIAPTSPPTDSPSTPAPSQEPGQTDQTEAIIGAAIVMIVLSAGLGLLIYLIKRK
ncbi:right-handed parallel beta-helix repeat-containing protein [Candidatus Bathyarchaeota archaeon]|nr:right-handed parallel beta-helix repeat-containing protein [Candidatus Bathyarchaeota archaeon]